MFGKTYRRALKRLRKNCPTLFIPLEHAEAVRVKRLNFFLDNTDRFQGLDQFVDFLQVSARWFAGIDDLKVVALLLSRAGADFATATEALLSGYHAVAFDSMRDAMEIELLLDDIVAEPNRMQEWLQSNERDRRNKFSPGALRERKANRLGICVKDLPGSVDYKAHSLLLHVNPVNNPFGNRGLAKEPIDVGADACFWDTYQHARNIVIVIRSLCEKYSQTYEFNAFDPPDISKFVTEYQEAMRIQSVIMDKLKAITEANEPD